MRYIGPAELRAWQKARNLTAEQMCALLQISRCTYSRWLNGRVNTPRWLEPTLARVADDLLKTSTAATTKNKAANEFIVSYRDAAGRPMTPEQRKALEPGATYYKSEPDGTWSEWHRGSQGYSDTHTGLITKT